MKLVTLSRRSFCGGCVGMAALAACSSENAGTPDAAKPDASGATCTTGTDVGAASAFVANTPKYFSAGNFFVVRDAGGLYALSARCTHEGATTIVQGSDFYCPRHGAQFTFNGDVVSGPVVTGLVHYGMCMLPNGHVAVNTAMSVPKTQRLTV